MPVKFARFLFFLSTALPLSLPAQNPHPFFINYTTEHGLPSPQVHYCLQDERGYLWFATDNGLCRFDGYEFRNFSTRDGLKDNTVFYLQKDPAGKIWAATMHGNLYFVENDSIHACDCNGIIQQYSEGKHLAYDFFINNKGEKFLSLHQVGVLVLPPEGSHRLVKAQNPLGAFLALDAGQGNLISVKTPPPDSLRRLVREKYWSKKQTPPMEIHADSVTQVRGTFHSREGTDAWAKRLGKDRLFVLQEDYLYEIEQGEIIWETFFPFRSQRKIIFEQPDGGILIGSPQVGGLRRYRNLEHLKNGVFEQFLEGKSPSHIFQDSKGGIWICTVDYGVFYAPDFEGKIYDRSAGLSVDFVSSLAFKNDDELYVGLRNGQVFHLDLRSEKMTPLPYAPAAPTIFDMVFDERRQVLWVVTGGNAFFKNGKWEQFFVQRNDGIRDNLFGKNLMLPQGSDALWGSHSMQIGQIDLAKNAVAFNSYELGIRGRFNAVWQDVAGRVWVGSTRGLFELINNRLQPPQPSRPALGADVEDLAELPDGTLVVATRGEGVLLLKGDFFQQITASDGLTSDLIHNVHADELSNIWAGTLAGLNKISRRNAGWQVEQFTVRHGLPSNEIRQVRSRNGQVWVATAGGLALLPEKKFNPDSPKPIIESALADIRPLGLAAPAYLAFWENNLTIRFTALNFRMNGRILYRFRMDSGAWTLTQNRSVNFPSLSPGRRSFEVQAQNEDGVWSESTVFRFTVRPPWWATWWAISLASLALGGAVLGWYKYRTSQLKKEIDLQKQLAELERQALRSQMNPHFLFNALNAIQGYIADGDKAAANRYLSRFSRLVRAALQHSRMTKVPLEDELRNLENYIELERMRFPDKFDYRIVVAEDINAAEIALPPMLIQPFLENAILHGLSKKEGKGQLDLDLRLENDFLLATITDNGIGIETSRRQKTAGASSQHHSVGMSITEKRLAIFSGEAGKVEATELKNEHGQAAGTQVRVWIPVILEA